MYTENLFSSYAIQSEHLPCEYLQCITRIEFLGSKKREHSLGILKSFYVRYWSEYETLDNDRMVNRNIQPYADTRDKMNNTLFEVPYSNECRTKKAFQYA